MLKNGQSEGYDRRTAMIAPASPKFPHQGGGVLVLVDDTTTCGFPPCLDGGDGYEIRAVEGVVPLTCQEVPVHLLPVGVAVARHSEDLNREDSLDVSLILTRLDPKPIDECFQTSYPHHRVPHSRLPCPRDATERTDSTGSGLSLSGAG